MTRLPLTALLLLAGTVTAPGHADPMRPLAPPAAAASSAPVPAGPAAAPLQRREAAPPDRAKDIGRLVAIREDSQGRRQALIGERWLAEGDTVQDAVVQRIELNSVELSAGKSRTLLHLLPPLVASGGAVVDAVASATTETARSAPARGASVRLAAPAGPLSGRSPRAPMRQGLPLNIHSPEGPSP